MTAGASSSLHDGMAQQIQPATSKTDTFLHKLHILILILILVSMILFLCAIVFMLFHAHGSTTNEMTGTTIGTMSVNRCL
jgi:flagellar basal body-associated protein FliL